MDEKKARAIAKSMGIRVYGTFALLGISYKSGIIQNKEELKNILDDVIEKGNLYISKELYEWVLETKTKRNRS